MFYALELSISIQTERERMLKKIVIQTSRELLCDVQHNNQATQLRCVKKLGAHGSQLQVISISEKSDQ